MSVEAAGCPPCHQRPAQKAAVTDLSPSTLVCRWSQPGPSEPPQVPASGPEPPAQVGPRGEAPRVEGTLGGGF